MQGPRLSTPCTAGLPPCPRGAYEVTGLAHHERAAIAVGDGFEVPQTTFWGCPRQPETRDRVSAGAELPSCGASPSTGAPLRSQRADAAPGPFTRKTAEPRMGCYRPAQRISCPEAATFALGPFHVERNRSVLRRQPEGRITEPRPAYSASRSRIATKNRRSDSPGIPLTLRISARTPSGTERRPTSARGGTLAISLPVGTSKGRPTVRH
jgi:hypothetical protein